MSSKVVFNLKIFWRTPWLCFQYNDKWAVFEWFH